jgi:hypothetical protein
VALLLTFGRRLWDRLYRKEVVAQSFIAWGVGSPSNLDKVRILADTNLFEFGPLRQQELALRNYK